MTSPASYLNRFSPSPKMVAIELAAILLVTLVLATIDSLRGRTVEPVSAPGILVTGFQVASIVTISHGLVWLAFSSTSRRSSHRNGDLPQRLVSSLLLLSNARLYPVMLVINVALVALLTFLSVWLLGLTFPGDSSLVGDGFSGVRLAVVVVANYILLIIIFRPLIRLRAAAEALDREGSSLQSILPIAADPSIGRLADTISRELGQVGEYQQRVRDLSSQTARRLEGERQKIARELHDNIGQNLAALLVLEGLMSRSEGGEERDEVLAQVQNLTRITLEEVHRLSLGLHPAILDQVGLPGALEWYVTEVVGGEHPRVQIQVDKGLERFDPPLELALYRIAQEALGNAARHSRASRITLQLSREEGAIALRVSDNGIGFDPHALSEGQRGHLGLFSMEERANLAGGQLEVISAPGAGTTVVARVPSSLLYPAPGMD